ncbi:hypothetical protein ACLOJK_030913 [Asimina triloba]
MVTLTLQTFPLTDVYGLNVSDLHGSGNLYGPATSVATTMNNQNMNSAGMQSKMKGNSGLLAHQPNIQTMQHMAHMKPQMVDHQGKMNFQPSHSSQEHLLQPQQQIQNFQQQKIQQLNSHPPSYSQFVQQPNQQKQQNQQPEQLLLKNDILRQSQLASNLAGQILPDHGMEAHNEALHSKVPEHLSELQNQYQQSMPTEDRSKGTQLLSHSSGPQDFRASFTQPPQQMQHMLHSNQQTTEPQHDFNCLSTGSQPGMLMQGHWHAQLQEKSHLPDNSSLEQHVQEEFHQRITGQEEAQRPHLVEGSLASQGAISHSSAVPQVSRGTAGRPDNGTREKQYLNQRRWLLFLLHARFCSAPAGKCPEPHCVKVQDLLKHMQSCTGGDCIYPRCERSRTLIQHYKNCHDPDCPVCKPVEAYVRKHSSVRPRPSTDPTRLNSANGSWKPLDGGLTATTASKIGASTHEIAEDLQSVKRMKTEHPSPLPKRESSPMSVPFMNQSHAPKESLMQVSQQPEGPAYAKHESIEGKAEPSLSYGHVNSPNLTTVKKVEPENAYTVKPEAEADIPIEPAANLKQDVQVENAIDHSSLELKQETNSQPADQLAGTKSGKPKIKGVSLTELFTPEQVREHIIGLRQWVGQSKAKAEKNQAMEHAMSENSCQLCAVEKLTFEPPPIYCSPCGARIKRNAMYYTLGTADTRHYFCIPCYNEARSETIEVDGVQLYKARMEKKRNDEETEEWWVQCDKCEAWQHQICALFNGRRNDGGQAEYTCPNCYITEIERGERKPLPQSAVLGAKDLPRTILSDQIEQRLARRLKQERQDRARVVGKNVDEVPGAEALVVRVVSSVDKKLEVKQRFLEIFQEDNYPTEFPYKSKKIEGVEVCLFGMYVQEFGSECQFPNQRRVYLSYLDSVKYFRPEIKTVTGEALRTFIGYLEYCKKRGFTSCYIWACPPLKGEDYILYCHPEIQKTPKSDKLREWYLAMLRKAAKESIVVDLTNLYDHFFVSNGECKAKVTAARLPYFDGDYWPGAAEDMINQLRQEEDGRKQQKKGKTKKTITKRALKAAGQADLSGNASKDALLMQKEPAGCYDAEQKLEERERHPINGREKHAFHPFSNSRGNHLQVEVNGVPADTKDKDEILESEFFDTRQAFLSLCQGNHYQYDTLRRAKHSSMMVLYHLHNPTAPAFVTTCNVCQMDIEAGQGWRCEVCSDFDVCSNCYQRDEGVDHPHKLTNHPSIADRDAQNKEARQQRVLQLRKMLDLLVHASQCRFPHCQYPNCRKVKGLFRHGISCPTRASKGCSLCKKMWYILQLHARACRDSPCQVPRCKDLKEHLRRLQQQSDSRRRAAVMEMMRQRAAEVAGNNSGEFDGVCRCNGKKKLLWKKRVVAGSRGLLLHYNALTISIQLASSLVILDLAGKSGRPNIGEDKRKRRQSNSTVHVAAPYIRTTEWAVGSGHEAGTYPFN